MAPATVPDPDPSDPCPDLLAALKDALNTIHAWHNMAGSLSDSDRETAWRIYSTHAPEMRRLHAAIEKAEATR